MQFLEGRHSNRAKKKGHTKKNVIVMRKRFVLRFFATCITYVCSECDLMFASAFLFQCYTHFDHTHTHDDNELKEEKNKQRIKENERATRPKERHAIQAFCPSKNKWNWKCWKDWSVKLKQLLGRAVAREAIVSHLKCCWWFSTWIQTQIHTQK